ncbi:MAG: ATP-dependent zinc protease [Desulfosarcinaceae bacterium]|jgi:hypothetical protein
MPDVYPQTSPHKPIIGWKEWVTLPDLGIPAVKAKIDTGARTSALHAFTLEPFRREGRQMVRFGVHPLQRRRDVVRTCEAVVLDYRQVKNSGGQIEERYVIHTCLGLGDLDWSIDLTLTNRSGMRFRMLLGRTAVRGRLVVDPGKAYLYGRLRAKAYGVARSSSKRKKVS